MDKYVVVVVVCLFLECHIAIFALVEHGTCSTERRRSRWKRALSSSQGTAKQHLESEDSHGRNQNARNDPKTVKT